MFIDSHTLRDLEIFQSPSDGSCVFDKINFTATSGGKQKLKHFLTKPCETLEQVQSVQEAVTFLINNFNSLSFPFNGLQLKSLEAYLGSNIEPVRSTKNKFYLTALHNYLIDKGAYLILKGGLLDLYQFTENLKTLFELLKHQRPGPIHQFLTEAHQFLTDSTICNFLEKIRFKRYQSILDVYRIDFYIRTIQKERVLSLLERVYEFDALLSMARASAQLKLCIPRFVDHNEAVFDVQGLYHLLVKNPVANSIDFSNNKNVLFLTGPNMAGKTTFLKALGVAVLLAHVGMGVPAHSMKLSFSNRLITSISIEENLFKGQSYFYAEVLRVKHLAESLSEGYRVFALFDELFKGTNVGDAYEASKQIISGFQNWKDSIFVISSHLFELGSFLESFSQCKFYHFDTSPVDQPLTFDYTLHPGISETRLGLTIINNEGIPELLGIKKSQ